MEFVVQNKVIQSDLLALQSAYEHGSSVNFNGTKCKALGIHGLRLREIENAAIRLCQIVGRAYNYKRLPIQGIVEILLCVYPERLACLENQGTSTYRDSTGLSLQLAKDSTVRGSKWILPLKVIEKKRQGRILLEMDEISEISEQQIRKILGKKLSIISEVYLDSQTNQVYLRTLEKFGQVVISKKETTDVSRKQIAEAYSDAIFEGLLNLKHWNQEVEHFLSRVDFICKNYPEYEIEPFGNEAKKLILEEICLSGKKWKEIRNTNIIDFLHSFYGKEKLELLDQLAPAKIQIGTSGKLTPLRYETEKVYVKAHIQKLYGIKKHPRIVYDQFLVTIELLAPNGRVVQCTDDILNFWEGSYLGIKKELAGRYPKHEWK